MITLLLTSLHLSGALLASQETVTITLSPETANLKINQERLVKVTLTSADNKPISAFDLTFQTSNGLIITDVIDQALFPMRKVLEEEKPESARIAYVIDNGQAKSTASVTIFLKVRTTSQKSGKLSLKKEASQITATDGSFYTPISNESTLRGVTTDSSNSFARLPAIGPESVPPNAALINFRVTLFGSNTARNAIRKPISAAIMVVGRVGDSIFETPFKSLQLTPTNNGTYTGLVVFPNFKDGNKFSIIIKPQNYLLKRICDTLPVETNPNDYHCNTNTPSLTIRQGINKFDFSAIQIMAGDLGAADGILNGYDLAIVENAYGKTDSKSLFNADLNFDGVINEKDSQIITYSLGHSRGEDDR